MQKEEMLLQKRLIELSALSWQRGYVTFSDFLNLNELNILHSIPKGELSGTYALFGGYEYAERQMAAFLPDALCYEYHYPIQILKISPLQKKFAEKLTHRDYLGALLNLGIERSKTGDILTLEDGAVVFVHEKIAAFITENLTRIRHTSVMANPVSIESFVYKPSFETIKGTVASVRLDSLLSLAFSSSRTKLSALIEGGSVFVNGKLVTSNGYHPKEGDIISVRKFGRFIYAKCGETTRKGRCFVELHKYI
ncbi:YlmH/Sll1252 family protein [Lachnoclostridium sp. An181]|uniref:YlmH/Sll1252 family protein n=1 Tax=Lachnoclostridium sp. An181 TaxID=1965575 RepID=UPI000B39A8F5|nr:YlmH/Sll1252 family protein [Lachnoclostridium sp. An181]OUP50848.1 RNA-binding protein [Lachnoclostridium sp. An181]